MQFFPRVEEFNCTYLLGRHFHVRRHFARLPSVIRQKEKVAVLQIPAITDQHNKIAGITFWTTFSCVYVLMYAYVCMWLCTKCPYYKWIDGRRD